MRQKTRLYPVKDSFRRPVYRIAWPVVCLCVLSMVRAHILLNEIVNQVARSSEDADLITMARCAGLDVRHGTQAADDVSPHVFSVETKVRKEGM